MNDKLFESFSEQTKAFFQPLKQMNQTFASQLEKLTEFQVESIKTYSQLGIQQLKSAAEIEDANTLQDFAKNEMEFMTSINQRIIDDARRLTDIGLQFKSEIEELLKDNINQAQTDKKSDKAKSKTTATA
ncbi:phasin family protein [Aliikangiella maris]|uniref:Phasin family protein n=2 Tax=Aliikangiella maris TaxID=3162458 RepID=A0ABV3MSA3_9GAMM